MTGLAIRTCTWVAPASFNNCTILLEVVPRTIESSIITIDFPLTTLDTGLNFNRTLRSRIACVG